MASTFYKVKQIKRMDGRSSVAASAYRSGEAIKDEKQNLTFDYTNKQNIIHTEIITPDNAPEWATNRAKLWNMVEGSELRKNSQTARDLTISLHEELTIEENIELIQNHIKENFVSKGMVADLAIHDEKTADGGQNLHAHVMLTMRELDGNNFSTTKNRDWNHHQLVTDWRKSWENESNKAFENAEIDEAISMTKNPQQEFIIPEKNLSMQAYQMEKKGIETYEGEIYKAEVMQFEKSIAHNDNAVIQEMRASAVGGSSIHKNLYASALQDMQYEKAVEKQQAEKGKKPFTIVEDDNENNVNTNLDKNYTNRPAVSWYKKASVLVTNHQLENSFNTESLLQAQFDKEKQTKKIYIPEIINPNSFVDKLNNESESGSDDNINQKNSIFDKFKYYSEKLHEWTTNKFYQEMERLSIKSLLDKRNTEITEQETKFASVGQGAINENNLHHQKTDKDSLQAQYDIARKSNLQNILQSGKSKTNLVDKFKTRVTDKVELWAEKMGYKPETINTNNSNDSIDIIDSTIENIQIADNIEANKEKPTNKDMQEKPKLNNEYLLDKLLNNTKEDNEIEDNEINDEPRKGR